MFVSELARIHQRRFTVWMNVGVISSVLTSGRVESPAIDVRFWNLTNNNPRPCRNQIGPAAGAMIHLPVPSNRSVAVGILRPVPAKNANVRVK